MTDASLRAEGRMTDTWRPLKRFLRTPKGVLLLLFTALLPVAAVGSGWSVVWPGVLAACVAAVLVDVPILRIRNDAWEFPSGALLTAIIVAMVLSPHLPWRVAAMTAAIGVASKYVARGKSANVFNPAALALLLAYFLFGAGHSWWGALPELPLAAIVLMVAPGLYITQRVAKLPAVLAFLGAYYLLATLAAFVADPAHVAELYREPDLHAALFFALFMVTDPPTSPPKPRDQITFGVITAVVSFAVFQLLGAVYFLLAGLLVANVWEAWRRHRLARWRASGRAVAA